MIAIICTDGQLDINNIEKECVAQKWIPLTVLKRKYDKKILLPVFNLTDIAFKFIVRNLPKNWKHGCVYLSDSDIEKILKKGWQIEPFDFPRKVNEHPDFDMTFEIHEFEVEPDFFCN